MRYVPANRDQVPGQLVATAAGVVAIAAAAYLAGSGLGLALAGLSSLALAAAWLYEARWFELEQVGIDWRFVQRVAGLPMQRAQFTSFDVYFAQLVDDRDGIGKHVEIHFHNGRRLEMGQHYRLAPSLLRELLQRLGA
jgi:hypothetical protein